MIVAKFGGTSVKDAKAISNVIEIISEKGRSGSGQLVVVSAMSGVTDLLYKLTEGDSPEKYLAELNEKHMGAAQELGISGECAGFIESRIRKLSSIAGQNALSEKDKAAVYSAGEILSSFITAEAFKKSGRTASHADSRHFIVTDNNYTEANVKFDISNRLISGGLGRELANGGIIVCGGFIGSTVDGETTTLGRGGSDYSAAIYAAALDAEMLEIWTDVDGILTCDPRIIRNTKRILKLSYREASELAYFGAKVLHPKTIHPAVEKNIPVSVKNTFNPRKSGTLITYSDESAKTIKSIAFRKNITLINIVSNRMLGAFGFLSKVFEIFNKNETPVDLVATTEVSLSLTIENTASLDRILEDLGSFATIEVTGDHSIVSVIGEGIKHTAGIAARVFGVMKGINIYMVSVGASEVNLSMVISNGDLQGALELIHGELFDSGTDEEVFTEI